MTERCITISKDARNMKEAWRKELWFEVPSRRGFINITPTVEECLRESGVQEGLILVKAKQI